MGIFYRGKPRKFFLNLVMILTLTSFFTTTLPKKSYAIVCPPCAICNIGDCIGAIIESLLFQILGTVLIRAHIKDEFKKQRRWLYDIFFLEHLLPALMLFTEQMSAVAMHQVMIVGMFLDAKHQLETQLLFQQLQAQAHKDYHPSDDFCVFGTGVRSVAASEERGHYNKEALNRRQLMRHLGNANMGGAETGDQDKAARWRQFTRVYCDPQDNNWDTLQPTNTGLALACNNGGGNTDRINIDVDYTRLIDEKRTLDVAFQDPLNMFNVTPDAEDVMALGQNLFGHNIPTREVNAEYLKNKQYQHLYLALRSVVAKRNVAENSFNAIVGMKSSGSSDEDGAANPPKTREFLAAVLTELGVPDDEVFEIIGLQPSYYAQLEILAKKIYQNQNFYKDLYDTPANVTRKSVALRAIELMLDRAIYESQLRREMATSVLLAAKLRPAFRDVNQELPAGGGL